ncbi:MAG: branched-chain amino acid ABC transporter permease [Scytolyngbya sp. HA4215-MV1]|jgi:neutral amino acid transport system permease protein|nr:branched-chain amino acid ABC transporter permease [Scytolyngbya sp. HA4215-MV1]
MDHDSFSVGYLVSLIIFTGTYALFSLGLNLQWGFTGLINFGHIAFMTVGAYTTILLSLAQVPLILATLMGAGVAALLGLLIGFSTLRLREDYLAIVTIGVSEVVRLIALNEEWLTRGPRGVYGYPLPLEGFRPTLLSKGVMIAIWTVIFAIAFWQLGQWVSRKLKQNAKLQQVTTENEFTPIERSRPIGKLVLAGMAAILGLVLYGAGAASLFNYDYKAGLMLVLVIVLALIFWRLEWLVRSPWGRVLKAIREDEEVAKALGKNVFWYKLQSLMLGGAIAGLAGAFYAWNLSFVNPDGFIPLITFQAWTIVVLGGAGNNVGTPLGAAIFWGYNTITRFALEDNRLLDASRAGAFRIMVIGLLLMILMVWRPQGILGKKEELTLGR